MLSRLRSVARVNIKGHWVRHEPKHVRNLAASTVSPAPAATLPAWAKFGLGIGAGLAGYEVFARSTGRVATIRDLITEYTFRGVDEIDFNLLRVDYHSPPPTLPAVSHIIVPRQGGWLWTTLRLDLVVNAYRATALTMLLVLRGTFLTIRFLPVFALLALSYVYKPAEEPFAALLVYTMESCGPAFVKFGQWAASRPDLFSDGVCRRFLRLHNNAPIHPLEDTLSTLAREFTPSELKAIDQIQADPIGSGCVAQVHKARLRLPITEKSKHADGHLVTDSDGTEYWGVPVVIKVMHPTVGDRLERDVTLMVFAAYLLELLPGGKWLSFVDAATQFRDALLGQLDLRVEARNLERFAVNFKDMEASLTFPHPYWPFVSKNLLVESFEEGVQISELINAPVKTKADLARRIRVGGIGFDSFLQMLVLDNFVHGDLHPGNLLLRGDPDNYQVVGLDAGIVIELGPEDRKHFVQLFSAIARGKGYRAGELLIENAKEQECEDPEAFKREVAQVVDGVRARTMTLGEVSIGEILFTMLSLAREHRVKLDGIFSSLAVAMGLAEGIGRRLDPDVDLLRRSVPYLYRLAKREAYKYALDD